MRDLAQLQADMAEGLLTGRFDALAGQVLIGPVAAAEALSIHRNTALHGLVQALRLTYPTVDALTGAAFFDQAALAFVEDHPPISPWLTGYGAGFADFLAAYEFAADVPYLADTARLDLAIEAAAHDVVGLDGLQFDLDGALLTLDASLSVLRLVWPAHAIREALEAGGAALAALDLQPGGHALALWRLPDGAGVGSLAPLSAAVLEALLAGGDLEGALSSDGDPAVLQSDIFAAPFARLNAKPRPQP
jgi:hypothetical protein